MKSKKVLAVLLVVLVLSLLALNSASATGCPPPPKCTRTPGYWKNHPEAWPVDVIMIGDMEWTKEEAIAIMDQPVKGDKSLTMFPAWVATYLNGLAGTQKDCIMETFLAAKRWVKAFPPGSEVKASSKAWQKFGEPLYEKLDAYNNGFLCAPACD
jgi:hypothetical protein